MGKSMNKYHKLTEKIKRIAFEKPSHHVEELDRIIREELGKMAEDIAGAINKSGKGRLALECDQLELNRILGLTGGGEKPCHPKQHELANVYGMHRCEKCGNYYDLKACEPEKPKQECSCSELRGVIKKWLQE